MKISFVISAVFTMALITFTASNLQAQGGRFSIGPYVEMSFPTGDFGQTNTNGMGAGIDAEMKLIAGLSATGSVGYMRFGGKDVQKGNSPAVAAIPVRVGLRLKFIPVLYFTMEGGSASFTGNESGSATILAPGVGIRILGLDAALKYETWIHDGARGFWGAKVGYNF